MHEFIFVHLIDKKPVGTILGSTIPLHMTILHWFKIDKEPQELIGLIDSSCPLVPPFSIVGTSEALFGENNDIKVMKMQKIKEVMSLHLSLFTFAKQLGAQLDERWTGETNYNPHVSHQKDNQLEAQTILEVADIDLITKDPHTEQKTVTHRFRLTE